MLARTTNMGLAGWHRLSVLVATGTASCGLASGQAGRPDAVDLSRRVLRTNRESFVILPPRQVVPPKVTSVHYSPDKRSALVERINSGYGETITAEQFAGQASPAGEISLYWWDTRTMEVRGVWKDDSPASRVIHVWWMPRAENVLFMVQKRTGMGSDGLWVGREELWRVSARAAKAELVEGSDMFSTPKRPQYDLFTLTSVSPTLPLAAVQRMTFEDRVTMSTGSAKKVSTMLRGAFELLGSGGSRLVVIDFPKNTVAPDMDWDIQGKPVVAFGLRDEPGEPTHWYSVDPSSGRLTPLNKKPDLYDERAVAVPERPSPLRLVKTAIGVPRGAAEPSLEALWLETVGENPDRLMLTPSHTESWLLPGVRAAYMSLDALWVTPVRTMTPEDEAALAEQAEQARLVRAVKSAWLPLEDYARTHQSTYPSTSEGLAGIVPFAGERGLPVGLVYTYGGGSVGSIENPSATEFAYLPGKNGRAVLFADGHAAWVNR
jgi:prepilin-type processing-associated H-X9-DG protein